jgi:hypothetical protein
MTGSRPIITLPSRPGAIARRLDPARSPFRSARPSPLSGSRSPSSSTPTS